MIGRVLRILFMVLMLCFLSINNSFAHKVEILFWFQDNIIHIESMFDSGKEVQNGTVEVVDSGGNLYASGETDISGHFFFEIAKIDNLQIVLTTLCGHRAFLEISKSEIQEMISIFKIDKSNVVESHELRGETQYPTLEQIEFIVAKQISAKLKPIYKNIACGRQKRVSFHDVLGGIGYIVGLIGFATYLRYRYSKNQKVNNL